MEPSIRFNLTFLPDVSNKTVGDSDIQQNTVDPLYLTWPYLYKLPFNNTHLCTQEHKVFFQGCFVYKFESGAAVLCLKHGLTLKEARQEACLCGFQQVPFSQHIFINKPQTTTNTDSLPPPTYTIFSPTPLVPSSSTVISSTFLTHLVVT